MVLESLISPISAKNSPWKTFIIGGLYASVALFLSYWVFQQYSSLIMVFLTTMAAVPLLYLTIKYEEGLDIQLSGGMSLMKEP